MANPIANPVSGVQRLFGGSPLGFTPTPIARPVAPVNRQFGLNSLPQPNGPAARGLPSPSVGTVLAQTRTTPPPALSGLPYATPTVGASFGASSRVAPAVNPVGHPLQNVIGERY